MAVVDSSFDFYSRIWEDLPTLHLPSLEVLPGFFVSPRLFLQQDETVNI